MHAERLLRLADFLDTLPSYRFKFDQWVGFDWKGAPDLSCGTTACALGWATTIPEFRELGLILVRENNGDSYPALKDSQSLRLMQEGYGSEWQCIATAAEHIFGITAADTRRLFMPVYETREGRVGRLGPEASPKQVAEHIRKFVREKQAVEKSGV